MTTPLSDAIPDPRDPWHSRRRVRAAWVLIAVGMGAMLALPYFAPAKPDVLPFARVAVGLAPLAALSSWGASAREGKMALAWARAAAMLLIGWGGAAFMLTR